jgi:hypothetical protein
MYLLSEMEVYSKSYGTSKVLKMTSLRKEKSRSGKKAGPKNDAVTRESKGNWQTEEHQ